MGLQSAWGDPNKVRDSDVLRFQWPSIGAGWERGLLRFAQAQGNVHNALDDATLLKRVLELPNTTVAIILGSKDKVISSKLIRTFLHDNDFEEQVPVIELEGLGHDAFEEDVDAFVDAVEQLLSAWNQTSV
jgi:pimeloyl-ACP methyl ester carboxylesterase